MSMRLVNALRMMGRMGDIIRDTHGNVSSVDRRSDIIYIKPSGMPYEEIHHEDVCLVSLSGGDSLRTNKRSPSVDTVHHRSIYKNHDWVGAICHTHSPYAVGWSMTGLSDIPVQCTEHADYFGHEIRITGLSRRPNIEEWGNELELDRHERAVILRHHGVLTFADDPVEAVKLAAALENICQKAYIARTLSGVVYDLEPDVVKRWHERYMHGYGQK